MKNDKASIEEYLGKTCTLNFNFHNSLKNTLNFIYKVKKSKYIFIFLIKIKMYGRI